MARCLCMLSACITLAHSVKAQEFLREMYDYEDGLSHRSVLCGEYDSLGFLWLGTENGLNRFDGSEFLRFAKTSFAQEHANIETVYDILPLQSGDFLLLQDEKRIYLFNPYNHRLREIELDDLLDCDCQIRNVAPGGDGTALIYLEYDEGFYIYSTDGGAVEPLVEISEKRRSNPKISSFIEPRVLLAREASGHILIYDFEGGLRRWSETEGLVKPGFVLVSDSISSLGDQTLRFLFSSANGAVYASVKDRKGLWKLQDGNIFRRIPHSEDLFPLSINEDDRGHLAVFGETTATGGPGLVRFYGPQDSFVTDVPSGLTRSFRGKAWGRSMLNTFYLGTNHGMLKFRKKDLTVKTILVSEEKNKYGISTRGMIKTGPYEVLVSTETDGWYLYDLDNQTVKQQHVPDAWPEDLKGLKYTRNLIRGPDGYIWGSCYAYSKYGEAPPGYLVKWHPDKGFIQYAKFPYRFECLGLLPGGQLVAALHGVVVIIDRERMEVTRELNVHEKKELSKDVPQQIKLLGDDRLLLASSSGLYCYQIGGSTESPELTLEDTLLSTFTFCVEPVAPGRLLAGTFGDGLISIDLKSGVNERYRQKEGLHNLNVCGLFGKKDSSIWLSTYDGLYLFNYLDDEFMQFGREYQYSHFEFNRHSYLTLGEDEFLAGGLNGVNYIRTQLAENSMSSQFQPVVTSLTYRADGDSITRTRYDQSWREQPIRISRHQRMLELDIKNPVAKQNSRYGLIYRIEDINPEWTKIPDDGKLQFNYLPSGFHQLEIKQENVRGEMLAFPFLVSAFFYEKPLFWAVVFVLFAVLVLQYFQMRYRQKIAIAASRESRERQEFRTRVFSYVTHEFKTPLAVLREGVKWLRKELNEGVDEQIETHLQVIESNSLHMENLAKQLTEIQRIEDGEWAPEYSAVEAVSFCRHIMDNMKPLADTSGIQLFFHSEIEKLHTLTDKQKLASILINLLSNAIKHSPASEKIDVSLWSNDQTWTVRVRDHGEGIAQGEMDIIFEPFYSKHEAAFEKYMHSSGLGLTHVKYAIEKLKGEIQVANATGGGAQFTFSLPVIKPVNLPGRSLVEAQNGQHAAGIETSNPGQDSTTVLVVDDQPQLAAYLKRELASQDFAVVVAHDGEEAWKKALQILPDLVISDVKMPGFSGFELCEKIKAGFETSHIPVILVTGLEGDNYRKTGLKMQADAYLNKPVDYEELKLTIDNLFATRKRMREYYLHLSLAQENEITVVVPDAASGISDESAFLNKLKSKVREHLEDPSYGPDQMATQLNMSRAKFYRKLKAVLDESPANYLKMARLHRSKLLLRSTGLQINEITYKVGFNDLSSFSRAFQKEFGISPSNYRKKVLNQTEKS